jgi:hypothetical protein
MAAYYYVDGKNDLIRLVGNHVWSTVAVPPPDSGSWGERLRESFLAERNAIKQYRGLYDAVLHLDVEHKRELEDAQLDVLLDAGYPPVDAVRGFRLLMSWVVGFSSIETSMRDPRSQRSPSYSTKARRLTLDRDQMPALHADDYFEFGLDAVIAGLRVTLDG